MQTETNVNNKKENLIRLYWDFTRPFTLMPPAIGMLSGTVTALGAAGLTYWGDPFPWPPVIINAILGMLMAAVLNAASNCLNQIYDYELDKINKPERMLPSGRISFKAAGWYTLFLYLAANILALIVSLQCFFLVLVASVLTYVYSVPPFRTKRWGVWANLTIAVPRGLLLKVAGWSTVKTVFSGEPWYIGTIFFLFLLGAATTKDYSDMEGDAANNCITLPIKYGVRKSAFIIAPFFVLPFIMLPIGAYSGILTGNHPAIYIMGIVLMLWGVYTAWLIIRKPEELATTENHPSWTHMYLMMMGMQIGFIIAYVIPLIKF